MGSNGEETVRSQYDRVCGVLNLDQESMDAAWSSYRSISTNYLLEGDHLEWLGCALYVAGQSSTHETVEGGQSHGNKVSLTQILTATGLNLIEFFKKIRKWMEMAKLSESFRDKIEFLERKFEVASIIYEKYRKVFCDVFQFPDMKKVPDKRQRGRKVNKNRPCTPFEVFKFGWTLYIHIKSQYPTINDDLVNSHHLLLCCVDMIYAAALLGNRRDLFHPDCPFLVDESDSLERSPPQEMPCVITNLCSRYKAIEKECRVIRDYYWRGRVRKLFESEVLCGPSRSSPSLDVDHSIAHMLTPHCFYMNDRALNKEYELRMLTDGDFDERVFLRSNASEEIGTPTHPPAAARFMGHQSPLQHVQYGTPLMGRDLLAPKGSKLTPVSDATHSVTQLHLLLDNCPAEPSGYLRKICSSCTSNPLPEIERRVKTLGDKFCKDSPPADGPESFAWLRLQLSLSLYYKLLDSIMRDEERKAATDISHLQTMLEVDVFHRALLALCVEIVLFSYNSQSRVFPWVLELFGISAYHFYRLIEVTIKLEGNFPRSIIKHLNRVEEMVLSQLAWQSNSPLFEAIDAAGSVPPYDEVALPTPAGGRSASSPPLHPRIRHLGGRVPESPLSSLLSGERSTPSPSARRQLFSPGGTTKRSPSKPVPIAPKPSQGGGVTVTPIKSQKMQQYLEQQLVSITQQLAGHAPSGHTPTTPQSLSPSKATQTHDQPTTGAGSLQHLSVSSVASMASAGTQTSPVRRPPSSSSSPSASSSVPFLSPGKGLNIASVAEVLSGAALVSPGNRGASPCGHSPLPTLTVTSSPLHTPLHGSLLSTPSTLTAAPSPARPKRGGSLALFYRKMYQLAYIRIKDLCDRLDLSSDIMQKVWTCFEHSMLRSPDLLRDRHLDQVIMSAVYVLSKVLRLDVTFQEIMRQYRHQPQAKSHVYRSVLLNNGPRCRPRPDSSGEPDRMEPEEASGEVASLDSTPLDHLLYRGDIPVGSRGDIIQFYNKLFIGFIKEFALRFSPNEAETCTPSLSPLPKIRKTTPSPRKVTKHHQIFVSPHKAAGLQLSPLAKRYVVQQSPASQLHEINASLKRPGVKRQLDLTASPVTAGASPLKRPHIQVPSRLGPAHRPQSLRQQLMCVVSDRDRAAKSQATPPPATPPSTSGSSQKE